MPVKARFWLYAASWAKRACHLSRRAAAVCGASGNSARMQQLRLRGPDSQVTGIGDFQAQVDVGKRFVEMLFVQTANGLVQRPCESSGRHRTLPSSSARPDGRSCSPWHLCVSSINTEPTSPFKPRTRPACVVTPRMSISLAPTIPTSGRWAWLSKAVEPVGIDHFGFGRQQHQVVALGLAHGKVMQRRGAQTLAGCAGREGDRPCLPGWSARWPVLRTGCGYRQSGFRDAGNGYVAAR